MNEKIIKPLKLVFRIILALILFISSFSYTYIYEKHSYEIESLCKLKWPYVTIFGETHLKNDSSIYMNLDAYDGDLDEDFKSISSKINEFDNISYLVLISHHYKLENAQFLKEMGNTQKLTLHVDGNQPFDFSWINYYTLQESLEDNYKNYIDYVSSPHYYDNDYYSYEEYVEKAFVLSDIVYSINNIDISGYKNINSLKGFPSDFIGAIQFNAGNITDFSPLKNIDYSNMTQIIINDVKQSQLYALEGTSLYKITLDEDVNDFSSLLKISNLEEVVSYTEIPNEILSKLPDNCEVLTKQELKERSVNG